MKKSLLTAVEEKICSVDFFREEGSCRAYLRLITGVLVLSSLVYELIIVRTRIRRKDYGLWAHGSVGGAGRYSPAMLNRRNGSILKEQHPL